MALHAVLVGINQYRDQDSLSYCHLDVEKVSTALKTLEDVRILETLTSADGPVLRADLLEVIGEAGAAAALEDGDGLFIYFSGHGIQSRDHFLLCPSDYRSAVPDKTGLSLTDIISDARSVRGPVIILLDCCRSALEARELPDEAIVGDSPFIGVRDNTFVMFSCRPGQRSYESPDREIQGSLFTHSFCQALAECGTSKRHFTLEQVFSYTEKVLFALLQDNYWRWTQRELNMVIQSPTILGGDFTKFCLSRPRRERPKRRT